jgi:hypothetical protein
MELGASFKRGVVASFGYEVPYAQAGSGDVIISMPGSARLQRTCWLGSSGLSSSILPVGVKRPRCRQK